MVAAHQRPLHNTILRISSAGSATSPANWDQTQSKDSPKRINLPRAKVSLRLCHDAVHGLYDLIVLSGLPATPEELGSKDNLSFSC